MENAYIAALRHEMEGNADPERAVSMKRYMRDQFEFLGIPTPQAKIVTDRFLKQHGLPDQSEVEAVVRTLWQFPEREYQYFAMGLLMRLRKNAPRERIELLEYTITTNSWWDTVDLLASNLIGPLLAKNPDMIRPYSDKWIHSENIWLQRTAILFQLKYKEQTDVELLFAMILKCAASKEFFLQKAIGWALREYSKTAPDPVRTFVANHPLAPLSKREALKVMERAAAVK